MNAPNPKPVVKYRIQSPRPGSFWIVDFRGYVIFERATHEAAEAKVLALHTEDAAR